MPLFLVERNFAEELELGADDVLGITAVNDDVGVRWVYSFLSANPMLTHELVGKLSLGIDPDSQPRWG
jgi:hypothetical protein